MTRAAAANLAKMSACEPMWTPGQLPSAAIWQEPAPSGRHKGQKSSDIMKPALSFCYSTLKPNPSRPYRSIPARTVPATMGGGGPVVIGAAGRASEYRGGLTARVMFVAVVAASGGLLFGETSRLRDGRMFRHSNLGPRPDPGRVFLSVTRESRQQSLQAHWTAMWLLSGHHVRDGPVLFLPLTTRLPCMHHPCCRLRPGECPPCHAAPSHPPRAPGERGAAAACSFLPAAATATPCSCRLPLPLTIPAVPACPQGVTGGVEAQDSFLQSEPPPGAAPGRTARSAPMHCRPHRPPVASRPPPVHYWAHHPPHPLPPPPAEFFPDVYNKKQGQVDDYNPYCVFDDQLLALFTSR